MIASIEVNPRCLAIGIEVSEKWRYCLSGIAGKLSRTRKSMESLLRKPQPSLEIFYLLQLMILVIQLVKIDLLLLALRSTVD